MSLRIVAKELYCHNSASLEFVVLPNESFFREPMTIRLETSKRSGIRNFQGCEISEFHRNWNEEIKKTYPRVTPRTDMSALYNCHGLTFACRRTRIEETNDVLRILLDDHWAEVDLQDVLPGDIVVYFSEEGEANHSGLVVTYDQDSKLPMICSKWNLGGEYIHAISDCPDIYGPVKKFYRCRL